MCPQDNVWLHIINFVYNLKPFLLILITPIIGWIIVKKYLFDKYQFSKNSNIGERRGNPPSKPDIVNMSVLIIMLSVALCLTLLKPPQFSLKTPVNYPNPLANSPYQFGFDYEVRYGDTLDSISKQFDVPKNKIPGAEFIEEATDLPEGEILFIPASVAIVEVKSRCVKNKEHLVLENIGELPVSLDGWNVNDRDGFTYTIQDKILYQDGLLNIYTGVGEETEVDLYIGIKGKSGLWEDEEIVTLTDANGYYRSGISFNTIEEIPLPSNLP
jgi:hypothetical protein